MTSSNIPPRGRAGASADAPASGSRTDPRSTGSHKRPLIGLNAGEMQGIVEELGFPRFHGRQVFDWVYGRCVDSFRKMTDLPEPLRASLEGRFTLDGCTLRRSIRSKDGKTVKYLFHAADGEGVESVALRDDRERVSLCISSQVGCAVGCVYCATGREGLVRNLTAGEIVSQVLALARLHGRPDSVLFMGMGEPLLNPREVEKSILLLEEMGFSPRKVTLSTCGIIEGIRRLADSGLKVRLAVSVGSSLEKKREAIIPHPAAGSLREIEEAVHDYAEKTSRRVSFEYTLMEGTNDSDEEARALGRLARRTKGHVNIIRCNLCGEGGPRAPGKAGVSRFKRLVALEGVEVTERYRRGTDIGAACGQLVPRRRQVPPASPPPHSHDG